MILMWRAECSDEKKTVGKDGSRSGRDDDMTLLMNAVINNDLNECTFELQGVTDIYSPLERGGDTALNLDILEFKNYVKKKTELNLDLFPFYQRHLFRKLKLNGYWNRLGCDQRMINSFAKDLGKPEDVVFCIEDYQKGKNKKFCEPIKGKGIRALFRRHGCRLF